MIKVTEVSVGGLRPGDVINVCGTEMLITSETEVGVRQGSGHDMYTCIYFPSTGTRIELPVEMGIVARRVDVEASLRTAIQEVLERWKSDFFCGHVTLPKLAEVIAAEIAPHVPALVE